MIIIYFYIILFFEASFAFSKIFPSIKEKIEKSEIGNITSINVKSYEEYINIINNTNNAIALFHVNWCGHCQHFKPILDKASSYKFINQIWKFVKVDCSIYSYICSILDIQMYPTIKIYKDKNIYYSDPPRDLEPLLHFLYKISDNSLINISSKENFLKIYGENSPLIEYIKTEHDFIQCIKNISNEIFLENFYFGIYESNSNKQKIIFDYSKINLPNIIYQWDNNCTNAINFLDENKYDLLNEINSNFLQEISMYSKIIIFFVTFMKNKKINNFIFSDVMNLSYKNRKYIFGYADYNDDKFISKFFNFNLNNFNEIKLIIYDFRRRVYYIHDKLFNIENHSKNEIIKEVQSLIDNIQKIKFTTGSKFQDYFFKFIDFNEMSPLKQAFVAGLFVLGLLCIIYILFHLSGSNENVDEDDFEEFINNIEENNNSANKNNIKAENNNDKNNSDKKKIE